MTSPDPGWYDDPENSNAQRYWDGQNWTPHRQRKPPSPPAQAPAPTPQQPPPSPLTPPPPAAGAPTQPPVATKGRSGPSTAALVVAGLALLLVIAIVVASRVLLGSFLPGLLLVAVIAIIAVTFAVRSDRSVQRKAVIVTATVLVVALAIPASLKVVYPVYHHFFGDRTNQASPSANPSTASPSASGGSPKADPGRIKVTLNGADPSGGALERGGVKCATDGGEINIAATGAGTNDSYRATLTDTDPPNVKSVMLGYTGRSSWGYQQNVAQGDATASKDGRTYKITGHAARAGASGNETEPFEFDVTCPAPVTYVAGSPGNYLMTLNGKTIAQGNDVKCPTSRSAIGISYAGIDGNRSGNFSITNPDSNPQLAHASINLYDSTAQSADGSTGSPLSWSYEDIHNAQTGPATVTKQGKTYKITGKMYSTRDPSNTEPFEFDATCS